jgi:hypothetical protein
MIGGAISIIGGEILHEMSKPQDGQARTTTSGGSSGRTVAPKRAAKKGGPAKEGEKGGPGVKGGKEAAIPPALYPGDTKAGFPVDGGTVHRGTGMTRDRKAIFCWVTVDKKNTAKDRCTQYKQYQFITVNAKTKWGNGPEQDANAAINAKHDKGIKTGTGTMIKLGELTGDGHPALVDPDKATMTDPNGKEVIADPYRPDQIPGVPGASGLIDAPSWHATAGALLKEIAPKDVQTLPPKKTQPDKPVDTALGTMKFLQHFRTFIYCTNPKPKKCLGYFEWDYDETVSFSVTWKETEASLGSKVGMNTGPVGGKKKTQAELDKEEANRPKTWEPNFMSTTQVDGPKNFSAWTNPC